MWRPRVALLASRWRLSQRYMFSFSFSQTLRSCIDTTLRAVHCPPSSLLLSNARYEVAWFSPSLSFVYIEAENLSIWNGPVFDILWNFVVPTCKIFLPACKLWIIENVNYWKEEIIHVPVDKHGKLRFESNIFCRNVGASEVVVWHTMELLAFLWKNLSSF